MKDEVGAQMELLKSQVQNLDEHQLLTYLTQLEAHWNLNKKGDKVSGMRHAHKLFYTEDQLENDGIPNDFDSETLTSKNVRRRDSLAEVWNRAIFLEIISNESTDVNGNELTVNQRIRRLMDVSRHYYDIVMGNIGIYESINFPTMLSHNPQINITPENAEEHTPYQNLLIELLKELQGLNYRRYKGQCCIQVKTPDGYNTRSWKPVMTIQEFVYFTCQKECNPNMWKNLTSKGNNAQLAVDYLNKCRDVQFPEIIKNRYVWAFTNGLFVSKERENDKWVSKFYPYDSNFHSSYPNIVASKYFELPFETYDDLEDWWDIPTPHFQSVLNYQNFEKEVSKWVYVMGGRLCFEVGEMDSWQVIPFLKGIARSGKSTLITKVFKNFYENEDVKVLSNNIEKKFGLSSICDGLMFIAPEVKGDLCLEQAEFQSLVSGEDVSIAVKHQQARSVEWKTPGILGGNEIPNWKDNSGSVLRRILPWNFSKQVMEADPHLDNKLKKETPAIILKCVNAYLDYSQKFSDFDIWNVVPDYFKSIQNQVAMVTNSLQNFLSSEKVRFGKELFCPQKVFQQMYFQHCQENNLGKYKFNQDLYAGPFSSKGLEVKTETVTYKGRIYSSHPIIFGCDIVEEVLEMGNDY